jgi:hypothetical protein
MIDPYTFESLILTNTIVAAFCIVLLITLTIFIIVFIIPSLRRQWFGNNQKEENQLADILSLSRQSSFHNLPLGSSRFNPIFEPATNKTTTNQFGALFHPQASIATLLHPTIWTSMNPTSVISSPFTVQSRPTSPTSTKSAVPPPVPSHPPTTTTTTTTTAAATAAPRSPKKR